VPLMVYLLWPQRGPARREKPAEEPSPASAS
jgi:hypothetical protein